MGNRQVVGDDHLSGPDVLFGPDTSGIYKGFRVQALYALWRTCELISTDETLMYRLEGYDDFEVLDENQLPLTVHQIKSSKTPFSVSQLLGGSETSFLHRFWGLSREFSHTQFRIVVVGSLGQELKDFTNGDPNATIKVAEKFAKHLGVNWATARDFLSRLSIEVWSDQYVYAQVGEFLSDLQAGTSSSDALKVMQSWITEHAECRSVYSKLDFVKRIQSIGSFLQVENDFRIQWGHNIEGLPDSLDPIIDSPVKTKFMRGVSVEYEHILANLDIPRKEWTDVLDKLMVHNKVVFLHGASGQGKSALAYRYLRSYVDQVERYRVKSLRDLSTAQAVAQAIRSYLSKTGMRMTLYIDVGPQTALWEEFLSEIVRIKNLRVLVTLREEDWQRITLAIEDVDLGDLHLTLTKDDAEKLWDAIPSEIRSESNLRFQSAWKRLGGAGPLMEFMHLCVDGVTLRERLTLQVGRYREDEVNSGRASTHLHLLRVIAVASESGGVLSTEKLESVLGLPGLRTAIRQLHQEYLIESYEDSLGAEVGALHPLRSRLLVEILLPDPSYEQAWVEAAQDSLKSLRTEHVADFVFYSAIHRKVWFDDLLAQSLGNVRSWQEAIGFLNSAIWIGIAEYAQRNDVLVTAIRKQHGASWSLLLDLDVAGVSDGLHKDALQIFRINRSKEQFLEVLALAVQQEPLDGALSVAKDWISGLNPEQIKPIDVDDWVALAEVSYWIGKWSTSVYSHDFVTTLLDTARDGLDATVLSDVIYGLYQVAPEVVSKWCRRNHDRLITLAYSAISAIKIVRDEDTLTAAFWADAPLLEEFPSHNDFAVSSLKLLRGLFPDCSAWKSHGYGPDIVLVSDQQTDLNKRFVETSIPHEWCIKWNSLLLGLLEVSSRPKTEKEYFSLLESHSKAVVRDLNNLHRGLVEIRSKSRRKDKSKQVLDREIVRAAFNLTSVMNTHPLIPISVVGKWGVTEHRSVKSGVLSLHSDNPAHSSSLAPVCAHEWRSLAESNARLARHASTIGDLFLRIMLPIKEDILLYHKLDHSLVLANINRLKDEIAPFVTDAQANCRIEDQEFWNQIGEALSKKSHKLRNEVLSLYLQATRQGESEKRPTTWHDAESYVLSSLRIVAMSLSSENVKISQVVIERARWKDVIWHIDCSDITSWNSIDAAAIGNAISSELQQFDRTILVGLAESQLRELVIIPTLGGRNIWPVGFRVSLLMMAFFDFSTDLPIALKIPRPETEVFLEELKLVAISQSTKTEERALFDLAESTMRALGIAIEMRRYLADFYSFDSRSAVVAGISTELSACINDLISFRFPETDAQRRSTGSLPSIWDSFNPKLETSTDLDDLVQRLSSASSVLNERLMALF